MILGRCEPHRRIGDSPRIRGDDPIHFPGGPSPQGILPVFAGMIPTGVSLSTSITNSPRIRGDDPVEVFHGGDSLRFSPYSRG